MAIATVRPHRIRKDRPDTYADRAALVLTGEGLTVNGVRGEHYRYPLATRHDAGDQAVSRIVMTRTANNDQAGEGYDLELSLVNRQGQVICALPGISWDNGELKRFCTAAGVPFAVDTLRNYKARAQTYPKLHGAPTLPIDTRAGTLKTCLLVLLAMLVIFGLALMWVSAG